MERSAALKGGGEWDESKHPRDDHGRFGEGGGEGEKVKALATEIWTKGGFTYNPATGESPTTGVVVSLPRGAGFEKPYTEDQFKADAENIVESYITKVVEAMRDGKLKGSAAGPIHIGAWHDTDTHRVVFDVNEVYQDRREATNVGKQREQDAVWDIGRGELIDLRKPQKSWNPYSHHWKRDARADQSDGEEGRAALARRDADKAFNPDQERDESGRWSAGSGDGGRAIAGQRAGAGRDRGARYGQAQEHSASVVGQHFSREPRSVLDSSLHGTGLRDAADRRVAGDKTLSKRIYFYVDEGSGVRPEQGVGGTRHDVRLDNVYDIRKDPAGLWREGMSTNDFEHAILRAGYDGTYASNAMNGMGIATLIGGHRVMVGRDKSRHPADVKKYSDDQPRDDSGRWSADGGGDGASAAGTAGSKNLNDGRTFAPKTAEEWQNALHTDDVEAAIVALAAGQKVVLNQPQEVATLLDRLKGIADKAKADGKDAQNYDLCSVSVAGSNLFCAESKGIPRVQMPQLASANPTPGSRADGLGRNESGWVDISSQFYDSLRTSGVNVSGITVGASMLRATQDQLNGTKVAGIYTALESGKTIPGDIVISRDNYIVDGHHRWAAEVGVSEHQGSDVLLHVTRVDMPILEVLDRARQFSQDWGIPQEGAFHKRTCAPCGRISKRSHPAYLN